MPAATTTTASSPPRAEAWLHRPWLDLLVGCGAWTAPLLAVGLLFGEGQRLALLTGFNILMVFCNQPHYMATVYRAYRTPRDFHQYRFFTVYVTVFILLTAVIVHLAPALFPWLLTFYLTWSPWHYSGQNYGIAMMMIRRTGSKPTDRERNYIWWSYLASYGVWFLALHNTGTAGQANLFILPIPQDYARIGELVFLAVYLAANGAGIDKLRSRSG